MRKNEIEIYGHRGARGYFPENTMIGFTEALKMRVNGIELDVVVSKDKKVVVSHEPWMNAKICTEPDGTPVKNGMKYNIYKMNYEEIKKIDCGKRTDKKFPLQKSVPACKPLLSEVIEKADAFALSNCLPAAKYLIEIKCLKITETKFHPPANKFAELVYEVIKNKVAEPSADRCTVISFDKRILQRFNLSVDGQKIKTGLLFFNLYSVKRNIRALGFVPHTYLPYHKLITKKMIDNAHALGMKVVAWTVNTEKQMKQLQKKGVDGIITDYPDIAIRTCTRTSAS